MLRSKETLKITQGAIIAALYVVLTMVFAPISFGVVQVRVAEAFTILPLFTPAAIPGLFVGCLIANIMGGCVAVDVIFGSLATLIGALGGYMLRKNRWLVPVPAIIANTLIIPFVLKYGYGVPDMLPYIALYIFAGEVIGCYLLGELLASAVHHRSIKLNEGVSGK